MKRLCSTMAMLFTCLRRGVSLRRIRAARGSRADLSEHERTGRTRTRRISVRLCRRRDSKGPAGVDAKMWLEAEPTVTRNS